MLDALNIRIWSKIFSFLKYNYRLFFFLVNPIKFVFFLRILNVIKKNNISNIVEIGSGNSILSNLIVKNLNKKIIYINSDVTLRKNINIILSGSLLPFRNDTFQGYICGDVLEHVYEYKKFISESYRTVMKGSYSFFSVPFIYGEHDFEDYHRWTKKNLHRTMIDSGFSDIKIFSVGGIFFSINNLLINYFRYKFSFKAKNWKFESYIEKIISFSLSLILLPFYLLQWPLFFLDLVVDNDSKTTASYIVIAKK